MDEAGLVTAWDPSAEPTFGVEREGALGRPIAELIVPERLRAALREGLRRSWPPARAVYSTDGLR